MIKSRLGVGRTQTARLWDILNCVTVTVMMDKKKLGRPAIGRGTAVVVRLQPKMLVILDQWIAAQPKPMSRPEAFRQMLARVKPQSSDS